MAHGPSVSLSSCTFQPASRHAMPARHMDSRLPMGLKNRWSHSSGWLSM
jgi:hypothetical protein